MVVSFVLITVAGLVGYVLFTRERPDVLSGQAQEPYPFASPHQAATPRTVGHEGVGAGPGRTAVVYDQEVEDLPFAEWWARRA